MKISDKMVVYSCMGIRFSDESQIQKICNEVEYQYNNGICNMAIFYMSLHPDTVPLRDKVTLLCSDYLKIKKELDKRGLKSAVVVQSLIGHGSRKCKVPFQEYIKLTDGVGDGICCPLDKDFINYVYNCIQKIAKCNPSAIIIDDDIRLINRGGKGCACPLHLKRFNEEAGTNLGREELYNILTTEHEKGEEYAQKFVNVQYNSLIELVKVIRSAIDSVDPSIQGALCNGGDNCEDLAKILAGKNNPTIVRVGNACYSYNSTSGFTYNMYRTAVQRAELKNIDYLITEADNCPGLRYSKTAKQLNSHYIATILEGMKGALHHIGKEPAQDNVAYKKILSKNTGLYNALVDILDGVTWHGFKIPVPKTKKVAFKKAVTSEINSFGEKCFERLGLPMYFSTAIGGITCFTDNNDVFFTDNELLVELSGNAIFSSDLAKRVAERGFEKYLGVKVKDYDLDMKPYGEKYYPSNLKQTMVPVNYKKLEKLNDSVKTLSVLFHHDSQKNLATGEILLTVGATQYKNELGGNITVFSGTPNCESTYYQGYAFLNAGRKQQFIDILKNSGEPVIYYAGDENMYLKTGTLKDGRNLTSLINLCYDEVENLELVYPIKPKKVSFMDGDGSIKEIPFTYENGSIKTNVTLYCLDALILIIE